MKTNTPVSPMRKPNTRKTGTSKTKVKKAVAVTESIELPEQQIPLASIIAGNFNPRRNFSEEGLRELADNMVQIGLIHAITLRKSTEEGYTIVCGERRVRAAQLAGWETIRAQVREMTDPEAEEFAIAENLQREDITPFEQGQAFKRLIDTKRYDVAALALRFGRTRDYILSRIRLLELIPDVVELLDGEELTIAQVLELCRYERDIQQEVYEKCLRPGLDRHWRHMRATELKRKMADIYLARLDTYLFDKTECVSCASNRANQVLFAECGDCGVCQNRTCMTRKNTEYLIAQVKQLLQDHPQYRIGYFENCSQGEVLQNLKVDGVMIYALGYSGYYEAHPDKPEEPRREDFPEEVDYLERMNTYQNALEEYEQECADIRQRIESRAWIPYGIIGDRKIEFFYDEAVAETQSEPVTTSGNSDPWSIGSRAFTTDNPVITIGTDAVDPETGEVFLSDTETDSQLAIAAPSKTPA